MAHDPRPGDEGRNFHPSSFNEEVIIWMLVWAKVNEVNEV